jgi:hypothetical protein
VYRATPKIPDEIPSPPDLPAYDTPEEATTVLAEAGLLLDGVRTLSFTQRHPSADALWEGWLAAAIRTRAVVEAQTADFREQVRGVYDETIRQMTRTDASVVVPVAVKIVAGHVPDR